MRPVESAFDPPEPDRPDVPGRQVRLPHWAAGIFGEGFDRGDHTASRGRVGSVMSWIAVTVTICGFCLGGAAMCVYGFSWLLWLGVALAAGGAIAAWGFGIMDQYSERRHG